MIDLIDLHITVIMCCTYNWRVKTAFILYQCHDKSKIKVVPGTKVICKFLLFFRHLTVKRCEVQVTRTPVKGNFLCESSVIICPIYKGFCAWPFKFCVPLYFSLSFGCLYEFSGYILTHYQSPNQYQVQHQFRIKTLFNHCRLSHALWIVQFSSPLSVIFK